MRKYAIDNETALLFAVSIFLFAVALIIFRPRTAFVVPSIIVVTAITIPLFYYIGSNNIAGKSVSGNALFIASYLTVSMFVVLIASIIIFAVAPAISLVLFNNGGATPGEVPVLLTDHELSVLASHQLLFKGILALPIIFVLTLTLDYLINMHTFTANSDPAFRIMMQALSIGMLTQIATISYVLYGALLTARPSHNNIYNYYIPSTTLQHLKAMKQLSPVPHLMMAASEAYIIVVFVVIVILLFRKTENN